jgi:hypothetical protein
VTGPPLGLEEDNFALFETQFYTPDAQIINEEQFAEQVNKAKKNVAHIFTYVKKLSNKVIPASARDAVPSVISLDDDDFVSPVVQKSKMTRSSKIVPDCSRGSSDDFVRNPGNLLVEVLSFK